MYRWRMYFNQNIYMYIYSTNAVAVALKRILSYSGREQDVVAPNAVIITTQPQSVRYPHADLLDDMSSVKLVVKKRCGADGMLTVFEAVELCNIEEYVILQKYILPNLSAVYG